MNTTPPPAVITAPDLSKGLASLKSGLPEGVALDPVAAVIEGMAAANPIVKFIVVVSYWMARGLSLPFELLLRTRIGERFASPLVLAACAGMLLVLKLTYNLGGLINFGYSSSQPSHPMPYIIGGVTLAGLAIHGWQRRLAQDEGIHWHSYSEGESRIQVPFLQELWTKRYGSLTTVSVAKNILEPLIPAVLAIICLPWGQRRDFADDPTISHSATLSAYFGLTAFAMFFYQYFSAQILRNKLLDHLDNQLMQEAHQESLKPDQPPSLTPFRGTAYIPATALTQQPQQSWQRKRAATATGS